MTLEEIKAVMDALEFEHQGEVDKGISVWRGDQLDFPRTQTKDIIPVTAKGLRQSLTVIGEGLEAGHKWLTKKWTHKFAHGGIAIRVWWYRD